MSGESPDFDALGLLGSVDGEARDAREGLLTRLHESGVSVDELRDAVADDRLALLPVEFALGERGEYSAREIAERTDLPVEFLADNRLAAGLTVPEDLDAPVYGAIELRQAERMAAFREAGFSDDTLMALTRAFGQAAARAASAVREAVGDALAKEDDTEADLAWRLGALAESLGKESGEALGDLFSMHLREQVASDAVDSEAVARGRLGGTTPISVCFADLVGFTRLGEDADPEQVGAVAERLAALAGEVSVGPVRLVKTIGDGVMLVSTDPVALARAALDLLDVVKREGEDAEFPALRAGMSHGNAIARGGDWYGRAVNRASRVCDLARPGSLVLTNNASKAVEGADEFALTRIGERRLKGVRQPLVLWRCRRA